MSIGDVKPEEPVTVLADVEQGKSVCKTIYIFFNKLVSLFL